MYPGDTPTRQDPPVQCDHCHHPIRRDELGTWSHTTNRGEPAGGWLCPYPHLALASPQQTEPRRPPTPIPPRVSGHRPTADRTELPQEWPPLSNHDWW
jgi:hypothetical protein